MNPQTQYLIQTTTSVKATARAVIFENTPAEKMPFTQSAFSSSMPVGRHCLMISLFRHTLHLYYYFFLSCMRELTNSSKTNGVKLMCFQIALASKKQNNMLAK